jgi:peptidoglycan/LPS O-acetylase OafA/YrhL
VSGGKFTLGYVPALDGLRGTAIALVVLSHGRVPGFRTSAGTVGVTLFFTLSGFLITALLLQEHRRSGAIALRRFYRRRVVRLLPALIAFVVVLTAVTPLAPPLFAGPIDGVVALSYVTNWLLIPAQTTSAAQHTWSLAVEEQFYVLWPLLLLATHRLAGHRGVMIAGIGGAAMSLASTLLMWGGADSLRRVYYGSDTRAFGLLAGCALAAWMCDRAIDRRAPRWLGSSVLCAIAIVSLEIWGEPSGEWQAVWLPVVASLLMVAALWATTTASANRPLHTGRVMRYLGTRSYGIYLWHYPCSVLVWLLDLPQGAWFLATAGGGLALAEISWRLIERPAMRRWRQDLGESSGRPTGAHVCSDPVGR